VPDATSPDVCSCRTTGSAVFRMISRRADLGDVSLALRVRNRGLTQTERTPARATDGLHLMLRYRSEAETYYVSVQRRDGHATIKRKSPGGPSNGGTYVTLADAAVGAIRAGRVQDVRATAQNVAAGVGLSLWIDGRRVLSVTDRGQGPGRPLRAPGRIGVRADNDDVQFDDVVVRPARR
jgi:acyl-coenzyme A thioesterase PaaI-like protein